MTANGNVLPAATVPGQKGQAFLIQVLLLVRRSLVTISRAPEALLPPVAISLFFLVIYQSTLGRASDFIPGISGSYLGFILPLSIVSSALSGAGIAAQNLVRDLERGYFDKLVLTPISRAALLLGPILAGSVILGFQAAIVVVVALLLGLHSATGVLGLLVVIIQIYTRRHHLQEQTPSSPHCNHDSVSRGSSPTQSHYVRAGGNARHPEHRLGRGSYLERCAGLPDPGSHHLCPRGDCPASADSPAVGGLAQHPCALGVVIAPTGPPIVGRRWVRQAHWLGVEM
ncbi:MAG: ABC transporter permease [Anaerolineae bacterium]